MDNQAVANMLRKMAGLLAIKGEESFKVRSYEKAADSIESLREPISEVVARGDTTSIPGIGRNLAPKVEEIVRTGRSSFYERLVSQVPETALELLEVPGIGAKTAHLLFTQLGITDLSKLEEEMERGSLERLPGFGRKRVELIARGIEEVKKYRGKWLLGMALPLAEELAFRLRSRGFRCEPVGEVRRRCPVVSVVDLLVTWPGPQDESTEDKNLLRSAIEDTLGVRSDWDRDSVSGLVRGVVSSSGPELRVYFCDPGEFGIWTFRLTGEDAYVARIQRLLSEAGYVATRRGLVRTGGEEVSVAEEETLFRLLGLCPVPPEIRHRPSLWEQAEKGGIRLITVEDVRGDLHVHTTASDGTMDLPEAAETCLKLGYEYMAVTDHATRISFIDGLDEQKIRMQREQIAGLRKSMPGIRILGGVEVDVLKDGSLALSREDLDGFEWVVAAIHQGFEPPSDYVERLKRAAENPAVHVIAHPSGRKMGRRPPACGELEELVEICAKSGTCLEVNASPDRLDLDEVGARLAWEAGVMLVLGTDAHSVRGLTDMRYGVDACLRRAGLPPEAVLNSRPLAEWFPLDKRSRVSRHTP